MQPDSSFTRSLHGEDKASTNIHKCSHLNSVSRFFFTYAFKLKHPRSFRVHMHGTIMELEAVDAGCWRTHAPTDQLIFLKKKKKTCISLRYNHTMSTLYKLFLKKRQVTRQVSAKTNKYQHTFITNTIRDWNFLPNRVVEEQSVEALKKSARCHV